jgi:hypothetical protein
MEFATAQLLQTFQKELLKSLLYEISGSCGKVSHKRNRPAEEPAGRFTLVIYPSN